MQHQSILSATDAVRISTLVQDALKVKNWVQVMKEGMSALEKVKISKRDFI